MPFLWPLRYNNGECKSSAKRAALPGVRAREPGCSPGGRAKRQGCFAECAGPGGAVWRKNNACGYFSDEKTGAAVLPAASLCGGVVCRRAGGGVFAGLAETVLGHSGCGAAGGGGAWLAPRQKRAFGGSRRKGGLRAGVGAGCGACVCACLVLSGRAGRLFLPEQRFRKPQRRFARPCELPLAGVLPKRQRRLWQPRQPLCPGVLHLPLAASGPGGQAGAGGDGRRGRGMAGGQFCAVCVDGPWRVSGVLPACGYASPTKLDGAAGGVRGVYGLQRAGHCGHSVDAPGRRLSH